MTPRPKTVTVVAGFLFLASAIAAFAGGVLFLQGPMLDTMRSWNPALRGYHTISPIFGVFLWALGFAVFAVARGLLRARRWAWWFSIALFAVDAIGDVVSYFAVHDGLRTVAGVAVSSAFLIALTRPAVRNYFAQQICEPTSSAGATRKPA